MAGRFSRGDHPPPEGKVRRSQALTTYGPGAMVDLIHDAVLVGGLDFWSRSGHGFDEPRLRERLKTRFPHLRDDNPFVAPPDGDERKPTRACGIQVLEFPAWFVCQKPTCRRLVKCGPGSETKAHRYVHDECNDYLVPVRFVMACVHGHIEEFPWNDFVHDTPAHRACQSRDLKLHEGPTGDFSELVVVCLGCHAKVPMLSATGAGANRFKCHGRQPWINQEEEECDNSLRLLVRTASNSYFPEVVSSMDIPEPPSPKAAVAQHWGILCAASPEVIGAFRAIPHIGAALKGFTDSDVLTAVRDKAEGRSRAEDPPRVAEFKRLMASETESVFSSKDGISYAASRLVARWMNVS